MNLTMDNIMQPQVIAMQISIVKKSRGINSPDTHSS